MSPEQIAALADFLARHAIGCLVAASATLLVLAFVAWRTIGRFAPPLVTWLAPHWARLDRRRFAARFLGWHAALAFVALAVAATAFQELAEHIGAGQGLAEFDEALAAALGRHLDDTTLRGMAAVTHLGDVAFLTGLVIVVAIALAIRRRFVLASSYVLAAAGGGLLIRVLKSVFERTRPERHHSFAHVDGYSFPSGHAAGSMLVYGLGAYLLIRHLPRRWHLPVGAVTLLLIVVVGASRVLLQVHYASDVLAGWMLAGSWGALCVAGYEGVRRAGVVTSDRRHPRR